MNETPSTGILAIGITCPHCRQVGVVPVQTESGGSEMKCYKCSHSYGERLRLSAPTNKERSLVGSGTTFALRYLGKDGRYDNSVLVVDYRGEGNGVVPVVRQCLHCSHEMALSSYSKVHVIQFGKAAARMRCHYGHSIALIRTRDEEYQGWTISSRDDIEGGLLKLLH